MGSRTPRLSLRSRTPGFTDTQSSPASRPGSDGDEPPDVVHGVSQDSLKETSRLLPVGGRPPGPV